MAASVAKLIKLDEVPACQSLFRLQYIIRELSNARDGRTNTRLQRAMSLLFAVRRCCSTRVDRYTVAQTLTPMCLALPCKAARYAPFLAYFHIANNSFPLVIHQLLAFLQLFCVFGDDRKFQLKDPDLSPSSERCCLVEPLDRMVHVPGCSCQAEEGWSGKVVFLAPLIKHCDLVFSSGHSHPLYTLAGTIGSDNLRKSLPAAGVLPTCLSRTHSGVCCLRGRISAALQVNK